MGQFEHKREILINRPSSEVFSYLRPLRNFQNWNPFLAQDPNTKVEFRGTDGQVGFVSAWTGKKAGAGEQEIVGIVDGKRIDFELRFLKPFKATNKAYFEAEAVGPSQTKVSWAMSGKTVFPMNIICMFMNMDKMMAKHFDNGLGKLKAILEK